MKKPAIIYLILLIIILGAAISWGYFRASNNNRPKISISPEKVDFGIIKLDKTVSQEVLVKNVGRGLLKIDGVSISCGCTTAKIEKQEIAPNDLAKLIITYDPQVHKETGEVLRVVYIKSNDPETPEKEIEVKGKVVE